MSDCHFDNPWFTSGSIDGYLPSEHSLGAILENFLIGTASLSLIRPCLVR
jgi:hypothetical protein